MSTQSIAQVVKDAQPLQASQLLVGVVVDNNDPDQRQKVRVVVPGILEADAVDNLPWLLPRQVSMFGVGDNYGSIRIPRVGSRVYVSFQDGDVHFGQYLADVVSQATTLPAELMTNYPNRVGWASPSGDTMYLDLTTKEFQYQHVSGTSFKIDGDGNVIFMCNGDFNHAVTGDYTLNVLGDYTANIGGDSTEGVSGDKSTVVGGDASLNATGDQTEMVGGSRTISCSSESHSGEINNIGDIKATGVSLMSHIHTGVVPGGATSGPPVP